MGTEIDLTVGGITLDWSKNSMGIDHGFLFQEADRSRCRADGINYDYYEAHPEEDLVAAEAALIRPLKRVLPRLNLLGHTIDAARAEYESLRGDARESTEEGNGEFPVDGFMTFEEFCEFCSSVSLESLDNTYVNFDYPERDKKSQGRFADLADVMQRIPGWPTDHYWSERSFFGASVAILSSYSMLQVFGQGDLNADAPVVWQYGPLATAGWAEASDFIAGARREQTILVATEGTSDVRILKRALDVFQPDVADFFRFIDVHERHHFWGAGNLVKFAEGLVRIDVQNKVLFILDNDAEGLEAYRRLQALTMPTNLRALTLPDQESFRQFPARGPEGVNACDINGRAAGIECYLDLNLPNYPPAQVIWSNYRSDLDTWQGALEHKESYMQHFFRQDDDTLLAGAYDATKLRSILDALLREAAGLTEISMWLRDRE